MTKRVLAIVVVAIGALFVITATAGADSHTPFVPTDAECDVVVKALEEGADADDSDLPEREVQGYLATCFGTAAAGTPGTPGTPGATATGTLPRTGSDNGTLIAIGAALIVLGGGAFYGSRRFGSQES